MPLTPENKKKADQLSSMDLIIPIRESPLGDYDIIISKGILSRLAISETYLPSSSEYGIITDSNVRPLYAEPLQQHFKQNHRRCVIVSFPAGEMHKTVETYGNLHEQLASCLTRKDIILLVGGGVTGDMGGFVASTYMRGIPFYQIPTSLLAMVDSAVGGKLGIDTSKGKNTIGIFRNPKAVFIDPECLKTLPQREYISGLGEIFKHHLLDSQEAIDRIESQIDKIRARDNETLIQIIAHSVRTKLKYVTGDETEKNKRGFLNLGHTFGHALESSCGYGRLSHGHAIILGMRVALYISEKLLGLSVDFISRVDHFLEGLDIPLHLHSIPDDGMGEWPSVEKVAEYLYFDKKREHSGVVFVLLRRIGQPEFHSNISESLLMEAICRVL